MSIKKKKKETSKILLFWVLLICFLFLLAIVIAWIVFDRTEAAAMAAIFAFPITAVIIWYFNKSKAENLLKIRKTLLEDPTLSKQDRKEIIRETNRNFVNCIDQRIVDLHNDSQNNPYV